MRDPFPTEGDSWGAQATVCRVCIQPHVDNDFAALTRRNTRGLRGRDRLVQTRVAARPVAWVQQGGAELAPTPQQPRTLDKTRRLPMSIDLADSGTRRMR